MTESTPSVGSFDDPEDLDAAEEFELSDDVDPLEPDSIPQEPGLADVGEADPVDVADQEEPVGDDEEDEEDVDRDG